MCFFEAMGDDFNSIRSTQLTRALAMEAADLKRTLETFDLQTVGDQTVLARLIGQDLYFSRTWGAGWADRLNGVFRFLTPINVLGFIPDNMLQGLPVLPIDNSQVNYIYLELASHLQFTATPPGDPFGVAGFSLLFNDSFLVKSDTVEPASAPDGTTFVTLLHVIQPVQLDSDGNQKQQDFYEP